MYLEMMLSESPTEYFIDKANDLADSYTENTRFIMSKTENLHIVQLNALKKITGNIIRDARGERYIGGVPRKDPKESFVKLKFHIDTDKYNYSMPLFYISGEYSNGCFPYFVHNIATDKDGNTPDYAIVKGYEINDPLFEVFSEQCYVTNFEKSVIEVILCMEYNYRLS